jgi:C4-dicarboxylate-specific signal transduction histidine kinase
VANQATDFANELAGFAAGRRGEMQVLDVNEVIRMSTKDLQELPKYKSTERRRLDLDLLDKELRCEIFENPFIQIVRNIVINAFQALEDSSDARILISSRGVDGFAKIRFQDNGPGIPSDYRERIFEPTFTTKPDGNGIGLWLVQTQLEQIGGSIELEGKEDGGASFVVTIPLASNGGRPAA